MPVSRQYMYQLRKKAEGKCIICAEPLFSKTHCEKHHAIYLEKQRAKSVSKAWIKGKAGRPPKYNSLEIEKTFDESE